VTGAGRKFVICRGCSLHESINENSVVQPAKSGGPTQDCRSSSVAFEAMPVVSPVGSEANCHPNGNPDDCRRPAAGQLARKIALIGKDEFDKKAQKMKWI
jgi:hypothetical protein